MNTPKTILKKLRQTLFRPHLRLECWLSFGFNLGNKLHHQLFHPTNAPLSSIKIPGIDHPIWIRPNSSDLMVFRDVFLRGHRYKLPFEPKTFVDAGANIGLVSILIAAKYPTCQIIAIEPDAENYQLLLTNIKPYPNIQPLRAALWKDDGGVVIADPKAAKWGLQVKESENLSGDRIPSFSPSQLSAKYALDRVDVFKIDIEGAEVEVFDAPEKEWLNSVKLLIVELHDRNRTGCARALADAISDKTARVQELGEHTFVFFEQN